jgi:pimeloyl-ACP methyl ester carboxylesterase
LEPSKGPLHLYRRSRIGATQRTDSRSPQKPSSEHRRYLDALLDALDVRERATFVIHDWGSALGFDWANRHREAVKGIAYMEAIVGPLHWDDLDNFGTRPALQAPRSQAGGEMVLRDNFFIEQFLPKGILRSQVACADRGDGHGGPFPPGRFSGGDRTGHRRLDGDIGLSRARLRWTTKIRMVAVIVSCLNS